jgi:hypothetical protein
MWIRFLKLCARRPLAALSVVLLVGISAVAVPLALLHSGHTKAQDEAAANPRQLIGRLWLNKYPKDSRDDIDLILFFGSGFGIYEHGSQYKATMEFFEFERQGDKVDVTFFQDKEQKKTKFTVRTCTDDPKFDLCVDFDNALRGPKRYRSWGEDGEDSAQIPWAAPYKRAVEERAKLGR